MTTTGNQDVCCAVLTALLDAREKVDSDERLNPVDAQVFGVIVSLLRKGEKASRARIATLAKCAQSSVPRAARKLAACGYLVRGIDKPEGRASAPTGYGIVTDTLGLLWDMPRISTDTPSVSPEAPSMDGVEFSGMPSTGSAPEGIRPDTERVSAPPKNNIKPPKTTSTVGSSSEKPKTCGEGGPGEEGLFGQTTPQPAPVGKPQPSTEANMPTEMTARMRFDADKAGFKNGSGEEQFRKWRTYHVAKRSSIKDHEASFRNWCGKANEFRGKRAGYYSGSQPKTRNGIRRNPYISQIV